MRTGGMIAAAGLALLAGAAAGCGGSSFDVSSGTMAGKIDGVPWTFMAGETNAFLSEGRDEYFADLFDTASTNCQGFGATGPRRMILNIPRSLGDYNLSLSLNATFVIQRD